jgi:hypothetical protein
LTILSDGIRRAKRQGGGVVVAVDIAKASDTVPHASIIACVHQQGLHPHAARLIGNMYSDNIVVLPDGMPLVFRRGVRQGDPLSPLLFNLVLDPVLRSLDEHEEGSPFGSQRLKVLAFADDLVLVARTVEEAQSLLNKLAAGLQDCGLTMATNNCEACGLSFKTSRALSTHERHKHTAVRNRKRLVDMEPRERPAPHGNTKWTQEEIDLLLDLNERYKDQKFINK